MALALAVQLIVLPSGRTAFAADGSPVTSSPANPPATQTDLNVGVLQPGATPSSISPSGGNGPDDGDQHGNGGAPNACPDHESWTHPDGRPYATKVVDGVTYYLVVHGNLDGGCEFLDTEWVPKLDGRDLVPDASDEIRARLVTPPVKFEHVDPVHGWFYVNTPMDFRLGVIEPVTATASASNILGTAWVTVTATPYWVTFYAGEPGAKAVGCSPAGAAAPYVIERPGECAYTYRNSSAISANGRTFDTTTTLTWTITYTSSDGPGSIPDVVTTSTSPLAIAEVQALVTCTGPLPEQGGC